MRKGSSSFEMWNSCQHQLELFVYNENAAKINYMCQSCKKQSKQIKKGKTNLLQWSILEVKKYNFLQYVKLQTICEVTLVSAVTKLVK